MAAKLDRTRRDQTDWSSAELFSVRISFQLVTDSALRVGTTADESAVEAFAMRASVRS